MEWTTLLEQTQRTEPTRKMRSVNQLKYPLPNPDISFERHWEILKAYVLTSNEGKVPVGYKDFGKLTVSPTHISANNRFFESIGIISKVEGTQGKYIPTPEGIAIQKELTWKKEANAKARLARLLTKSWFWQSTKNLLSMKEKVAKNELLDQLGYDSGADPTKHNTSLEILLAYLRYSELVAEERGMLVLGAASASQEQFEVHATEKPKVEPRTPEPQRETAIARSVVIGVFVSPEMNEEQIRKAVRIVLEEIGRTGQ